MEKTSFWDIIRDALKVVVSVATPILVVCIAGWYSIKVAKDIQKGVQERSNDIALASLVVDVLNNGRPVLYNWLPELIGTISDDTLQGVMKKAVELNDEVPIEIKERVTRISAQSAVGISDQLTMETIKGEDSQGKDTNNSEPTTEYSIHQNPEIVIVYKSGVEESEDKAELIKDSLNMKGFSAQKVQKPEWWFDNNWKWGNSRISRIWYKAGPPSSTEMYEFGLAAKRELEKTASFGEFSEVEESPITSIGEQEVLIVLPPTGHIWP